MFVYWLRSKLAVGISLSLVFILSIFWPTAAIACEGGGEEKAGLSVVPFEGSGGGGRCREERGKVHYTVLREWCEFQVTDTGGEEMEVLRFGLGNQPGCEFEGGRRFCLESRAPENRRTECKRTVRLTAGGGRCYNRLEYANEPARTEEMGYSIETMTLPGRARAFIELRQLIR